MNDSEQIKWFVAKTKAKQERAVVQQIQHLGVEAYVPIRTELRQWKDRKKKVDVVLIPNTVFVKAYKQDALNLHNEHGIALNYIKDVTSPQRGLLVIPDCQMEEFRRFVDLTKGDFFVDEEAKYIKGDSVIMNKGPFKGMTGELIRVDVKNKVVVRLEQLVACAVFVNAEDLELLPANQR